MMEKRTTPADVLRTEVGTLPSADQAHRDIYRDGGYLELNPTWHVEHSPWKAQQIFKIIQRNRLTPGSICEVGCGAGEVLRVLFELMPSEVSFVGYEVSPQAFQLCTQRAGERLQFHLKDILQDVDAQFDLLLAIDVCEHVEDCRGFLRQLRTKGKYKIFHFPLDISVQSVCRMTPILEARRVLGHLHYFTKETALQTLRDTGYEVIDFFYTSHAIELPGQSFKSMAVRPLRRLFYRLAPDLTVRALGGFSMMILTR